MSSVEQRMPDMSDSAWLATNTNTDTRKCESTVDASSVEPSQKDVWSRSVVLQMKKLRICSNPDPETAFSVRVKRRLAEVKVSKLSAEQRHELVEKKDKGKYICGHNPFRDNDTASSRRGVGAENFWQVRSTTVGHCKRWTRRYQERLASRA